MWSTVSLGDVVKNLDNLRVPLNSVERHKKSTRKLYPYIGANNIMDYIDGYLFDQKILCVAEDGGSWGKGQTCAVIYDGKTWVNNHAHVLVENGKAKLEYLRYFLNRSNLNKYINGSTRGKLTRSALDSVQVPLPSIEDQIRIADILSKAEALISQRKESIRLLDEFLRSTFIERFIKRNYPLQKLEDLSLKITDGEHKKPDYKESGMPFISVVNISKGFLNFVNCKFVSKEDHNKFNKRCNPEEGDILYTKVGATYGRAILVDTQNPFSLYVSVALIKPNKEKVNPSFLKAAINHPFVKRQADKSIKGAGVPDLHLIEIKSFKIPFPPKKEQDKFAGIVEKTEALKARCQASLQELENLYGSLSQKAFKGELNLKEEELAMAAEPEMKYKRDKK